LPKKYRRGRPGQNGTQKYQPFRPAGQELPHNDGKTNESALMEFDPKKLVQRIEAAEQAVQAEMRRLDNDHSGSPEDHQKLSDAISALQSLRRNSR
jgi:hypothetical protein